MNQIRLSFEAYKKSTFGGKQDKILSVFQTGVKIYFSEKYILGLGAQASRTRQAANVRFKLRIS